MLILNKYIGNTARYIRTNRGAIQTTSTRDLQLRGRLRILIIVADQDLQMIFEAYRENRDC
jgi:hypothetical protein